MLLCLGLDKIIIITTYLCFLASTATCWDPWILWPHESNHLSVKFMKSIIYQTTKCTFERGHKTSILRWCSKNIEMMFKEHQKNQKIKTSKNIISELKFYDSFQKCILWSDKWYFRSQITSLITLRTWKGLWVSASGCNLLQDAVSTPWAQCMNYFSSGTIIACAPATCN